MQYMNLRMFINKYFGLWKIAETATFSGVCGYLKLRNKDTFVKVYFTMHGEKHWTGANVEVDHVEACE